MSPISPPDETLCYRWKQLSSFQPTDTSSVLSVRKLRPDGINITKTEELQGIRLPTLVDYISAEL